MASYYVYHAAAGAGTGADWTNAFVKLNTAMTGRAAGDIFYVADDHAETSATAQTYTSPGTEANPCYVYCVRRTGGSVPPVAADLRETATISTTVASAISLQGSVAECYGIAFQAGSSTSAASITVGGSAVTWRFVKCALRLTATSTTSRINLGVSGAHTVLIDTTVQFGSASQGIVPIGRVSIRGNALTFVTGSTFPTNVFIPGAGAGHLFVEGIDFSSIGSGKNIIQTTGTVMFTTVYKDCRGNLASPYNSSAIPSLGALELSIIRFDNVAAHRNEKIIRVGRQYVSTSFVRTGGASDGTTPISWNIAPNSNCNWGAPFECLPISIWNETVGSSVTVTIEAWAASVAPTNKEVWIEVEYLGNASYPLGSRATSGVTSALDTGTTCPSGAGGWSGGVSYAMSVTVTPQQVGPITIYVMTSKSSGTVTIDPKPVLS